MMRYLLDTHIFLWFISDDPQLSETILAILQDEQNVLYLSAASLWEIAIKHSIGKLPLAQPIEQFITEQMALNELELLPILPAHTFRVAALPFYHRDPFDRLIAAQSLVEEIPLLSADTAFDAYGVNRIA